MTNTNHYINSQRTNKERCARYCFLRHMGLSRNQVRAIVGRSDTNIIKTLEHLPSNNCSRCTTTTTNINK